MRALLYLRFFLFFASAERFLAAAFDAFVASSFRCSAVIRAFLARFPFFPLLLILISKYLFVWRPVLKFPEKGAA